MSKDIETNGLHNDSLAPVPKEERTWGWFAIFNIWANDIQSLFGYSLVASLFIAYGPFRSLSSPAV